jgi:hypothetical protein
VTITIQATIATGLPSGTVISNQAALFYDADGNGTNESTAVTDDPSVRGADDPTVIGLAVAVDVPALDVLGIALLTALLALAGWRELRRV